MAAVLTAVSTDPDFAEEFRSKFIAPKMELSNAIYARAKERGEIPGDVDIDIIGPALAGILMHRAFILGDLPDDTTIERVVDHVILPAVRHPSCGTQGSTTQGDSMQGNSTQGSTKQGNHKLTKDKARKTT
jgi:hypothetical protein